MARLFEIEGLVLTLGGVEVLSIPSLTIGKGERLSLLGPNGTGKTCLLKVLAGLIPPSSGLVTFCGSPVSSIADLSGRVVYLHQSPYIMVGSVLYNIEFGAKARGSSRAEAAARAARAMRTLGLAGFGRRTHRALSGGEAQRVALARTIATGCDVLLLDEPTASADTASAELIARAIGAQAESGVTVVIATHDEAFVDAFGGRRLVLGKGRTMEGAGDEQ